jgi:hypothetical protein
MINCMLVLQVLTSTTLDRLAGHNLKFKCEIFQKGCADVWCSQQARPPSRPAAALQQHLCQLLSTAIAPHQLCR